MNAVVMSGSRRRSQMITVNLRPVRERRFRLIWLGGKEQVIAGYGKDTTSALRNALTQNNIPTSALRSLWDCTEVV